jgi:hypothetical protein
VVIKEANLEARRRQGECLRQESDSWRVSRDELVSDPEISRESTDSLRRSEERV